MRYDPNNRYSAEYLRELDSSDLMNLRVSAREALYSMRTTSYTFGKLRDVPKPHLYGKIRKDIARILTVLNERTKKESKEEVSTQQGC